MEDKPLMVTATDAQKAGFCGPGIYVVVKHLGGDMRRFIREGYPVSEVEGIDDANVQRVVRAARVRAANVVR
jgi:hypothetical protein